MSQFYCALRHFRQYFSYIMATSFSFTGYAIVKKNSTNENKVQKPLFYFHVRNKILLNKYLFQYLR